MSGLASHRRTCSAALANRKVVKSKANPDQEPIAQAAEMPSVCQTPRPSQRMRPPSGESVDVSDASECIMPSFNDSMDAMESLSPESGRKTDSSERSLPTFGEGREGLIRE